jgi:nucleoside-diphosphate-sugar epimerase
MSDASHTILVTGGTGVIGRYLIGALAAGPYRVRALTSRPPGPTTASLEWRQMDWRTSLDFDRQVEGCSAVLHLGAEKNDAALMPRVNVDATAALAQAADRAGSKLFCYTSSISVYGSPLTRTVDETSPVVTPEKDVASEYWAETYMRAYARSKVASERLLAERGGESRCVILRPSVVRNRDDIRELAGWSLTRKLILGGRLTHTVAVEDVVHSILWFLRETLEQQQPRSAQEVEIYNVADDDPQDTYAAFFKKAYAWTGDPRYRCPPHAPAVADRIMNWCKYRTLEPRWPLGMVIYSNEKLLRTGYRHVLGAEAAYRAALV